MKNLIFFTFDQSVPQNYICLLLLGNIAGLDLPEGSIAASAAINDNYVYGGVILNGNCDFEYGTAEKIEKKWKCFNVSIFEMFPAAEFPEKFLNAVGSAWRTVLDNYYKDSRSEVVHSDKLRTLHMKDGNGTEILSMFSYSPHYIAPEVYFGSSSAVVHKVSSFPEIELINSDGRLWTEIAYAPPNIPPKGVLTLKITEK